MFHSALILLLSLPQAVADRAISASGCDATGGENDQEASFVQDAFSRMSWRTDTLTGSGFTLDSLSAALAPARFRDGEKLFLNIRTHGAEGPPHMICVGGTSEKGGQWVDVAQIKPLLDALVSEKHVKIAVADGSCFGGGSIDALSGPGICVASSTYDNVTSFGTSIGASIAARVAARRLPAATARRLFAAHHDDITGLSYNASRLPNPELDGRAGISFEEAFLASRAHRGYSDSPHNHRPAQISSDVEGAGRALGAGFALGLQLNTTALPASEVRRTFTAGYFAPGTECSADNPFQAVDRLAANLTNVGDRQSAEAMALSMGFVSLADARTRMREYYEARERNYARWRPAAATLTRLTTEFKTGDAYEPIRRLLQAREDRARVRKALDRCESTPEVVCGPGMSGTREERLAELGRQLTLYSGRVTQHQATVADDTALSAKLAEYDTAESEYNAALDEDASIQATDTYMRLEKVYYHVNYLSQRERTRDDDKARACSDFVF